MSIKINGWGKWGKNVLDALQGPNAYSNLHAITTDSLKLPSIPDPVISDIIFSNLPAQEFNDLLDPTVDCHAHIIHAADHFGSGAICGAMRNMNKLPDKIHMGVILIPPIGSNSATVGRLLTNILGLKNFFDICILLDLNSPVLINRNDLQIAQYVAALCNLLQIFERSACMLPILKQMQARFFAFASSSIAKIIAADSLEELSQTLTVCPSKNLFDSSQSITAFSVSKQGAQPEVLKITQKTFPGLNTIFIPFKRAYEWQDANDPAETDNYSSNVQNSLDAGLMGFFNSLLPNAKRNFTDFVGFFAANVVSLSFWNFLKQYAKKYWPEEQDACKYETLDPEILDWLKNNGYMESTKLQHRYLLRSARDFIKNSIQGKH